MTTAEAASRSSSAAAAPTPWLVGPVVDALFVANVLWPLVLLVPQGPRFDGHDAVHFWQLYFITTPHRWITLLFVVLDGERLRDRRSLLLSVGLSLLAACGAVRWTTGDITCLLAMDYVWNAWHFAAQHHGVYRIYRRRQAAPPSRIDAFEKWTMRGFLLYVIVRVAGGTWSQSSLDASLQTIDWAVSAVPLGLLFRELVTGRTFRSGALLYLVSVSTLYLGLLAAVHLRQPRLVLTLATASALFHAIEYLTLVGWTAHRHHGSAGGDRGLLHRLAPRWGAAIALFALIQGAAGWMLERNMLEVWLFANVVVAFVHYAFDGIIWRSPGARHRSVPITA
ncbi:MAG: hypothetical protein SH850_03295 [Planctomycetaceae bacterium]|nr:hypothetical protein [Planctomycetaceae bacterium]